MTSARTIAGLSAVGTPTGTGIANSIQIGTQQAVTQLTTSDVCYTVGLSFTTGNAPTLALLTGTGGGTGTWTGSTKDFQGGTIPTLATIQAIAVNIVSGSATVTDGTNIIPLPGQFQAADVLGSTFGNTWTFSTTEATVLTITVIGTAA